MTIESATYIAGLNSSYPIAGGKVYEGDDHLRLIKSTLKNSLPNISGTVSATHAQLNYLAAVTPGTVAASKALVVDGSKALDVLTVAALSATTLVATTVNGSPTLNTPTLESATINGCVFGNQAYFDGVVDKGTVTAAFDIDWTDGNVQKAVLGGDALTMTFTDPTGPAKLTLQLIQDATGGRTKGTWPTIKSRGGEASSWELSLAANAQDMLHLFFDGTSYYGQLSQGWA